MKRGARGRIPVVCSSSRDDQTESARSRPSSAAWTPGTARHAIDAAFALGLHMTACSTRERKRQPVRNGTKRGARRSAWPIWWPRRALVRRTCCNRSKLEGNVSKKHRNDLRRKEASESDGAGDTAGLPSAIPGTVANTPPVTVDPATESRKETPRSLSGLSGRTIRGIEAPGHEDSSRAIRAEMEPNARLQTAKQRAGLLRRQIQADPRNVALRRAYLALRTSEFVELDQAEGVRTIRKGSATCIVAALALAVPLALIWEYSDRVRGYVGFPLSCLGLLLVTVIICAVLLVLRSLSGADLGTSFGPLPWFVFFLGWDRTASMLLPAAED